MADTRRAVVLCAPLCFVFSKLHKLSNVQIVTVLLDCYTPDDISRAKRILVDDIKKLKLEKNLPHLRARRDADISQRTRKEAEDIVMLFSAVDRHNLFDKIPIYAVDNTDSIPTMKLEDGELRYFCTKIEKLEAILLYTQETVNILYSLVRRGMAGEEIEASSLPPDVRQFITKPTTGTFSLFTGNECTPSASRVNNSTTTTSAVLYGASVINGSCQSQSTRAAGGVGHADAVANDNRSTVANDDINGGPSRWANCINSASSAVETDDTTSRDGDDHDGDFTVVESRRTKRRRRRRSQSQSPQCQPPAATAARPEPDHLVLSHNKSYVEAITSAPKKSVRKPLVVGTQRSPSTTSATTANTIGGKLSAAKPYLGKAMFCVDNVSKDVTATDLELFVKSKLGVRVILCNETKPRRSFRQKRDNIMPDHKAFFLCINKADKNLLLNADKWPADVSVSAWFFKKKTDDAPTTTPSTAAPAAGGGDGSNDQQETVAADASAAVQPVQPAAVANMNGMNGIGNNNIRHEAMSLSPINADHSDEFSEAVDHADTTSVHNSTSVVVDLPSILQ